MKFSVVAALLATATSVYAQAVHRISVIQPILGAVWHAGQTHDITWSINDTTVTEIQKITLRKGAAHNLQNVAVITDTPFPASDLKYSWAIPKDAATDSSYSVEVTFTGGDSEYSPHFVILGAEHPVTTKSASPSGSAKPSGSASASASASSSAESAPATEDENAAAGLKTNVVLGAAALGAVGALLF